MLALARARVRAEFRGLQAVTELYTIHKAEGRLADYFALFAGNPARSPREYFAQRQLAEAVLIFR